MSIDQGPQVLKTLKNGTPKINTMCHMVLLKKVLWRYKNQNIISLWMTLMIPLDGNKIRGILVAFTNLADIYLRLKN
ncbi:hypothetical protein L798_00775 [Zootermopsis nevadensis]|uniref:Uncharacterized protein n=1 Tax=Zootermopsis nevadensis TaxID=136037 RepID=A0A067RGE4_ZOONE|nr:hypothetical protein L798_00775 [Zootermopsis nevadensis]